MAMNYKGYHFFDRNWYDSDITITMKVSENAINAMSDW